MQGESLRAYVFPPEIWTIITDCLEASVIKKLFHIGNRLLQATLCMSVHTLSFQTSESTGVDGTWHDKSLKLFPKLKTLEVIRDENWLDSSLTPIHFVNIPLVTKLNLQLRVNIPLRGPGMTNPKFLTREVLLRLPTSSLTWLNLSNLYVFDEHVPLLPPNLTYLKMQRVNLTIDGLSRLPPNLLHLVIDTADLGLTQSPCSYLPFGLLTLAIRNAYSVASLQSLPASLRHLELGVRQDINQDLPHLPHQLETLILLKSTVNDNGNGEFSLPPTITDLRFKKVARNMTLKFMTSLPPLLKTLHIENSYLEPNLFRYIPATVTDLSLCRLKQSLFPARSFQNLTLPPGLVKFTFSGLQFSIESLKTLPPTITTLHTSGVHQEAHPWSKTIEMLSPALPNLQQWINPPLTFYESVARNHLIHFINTREEATFLRNIGFMIARMNRRKMTNIGGALLAAYFVYRRSHIILPAAPMAISKLLLRCSGGVLGFGLALLYALF